jgi:hypothetical protein
MRDDTMNDTNKNNLIPVGEFKFPASGMEGEMFDLTCKNHPTARYTTKNPYTRNLHFLQAAEGFGFAQECPCAFSDLVVIVEGEGAQNA